MKTKLALIAVVFALLALAPLPAAAKYPTCDCLYCASAPAGSACNACAPGAPPTSCPMTCGQYLQIYGCGGPILDSTFAHATPAAPTAEDFLAELAAASPLPAAPTRP